MSTYQRIKDALSDGEWHSIQELQQLASFPERWLEELRRDGYWVIEDQMTGRVALGGATNS